MSLFVQLAGKQYAGQRPIPFADESAGASDGHANLFPHRTRLGEVVSEPGRDEGEVAKQAEREQTC